MDIGAGLAISGEQQVLGSLQRGGELVDRYFRDGIHEWNKELAMEGRAEAKARRLHVFHKPIRASAKKKTLTVRFVGAQFAEFGTGKHRTEPYSPRSRRSLRRGGGPWEIKPKGSRVLLADKPYPSRPTWRGRSIVGARAEIPGAPSTPFLAAVIERQARKLAETVGPRVLEVFSLVSGQG